MHLVQHMHRNLAEFVTSFENGKKISLVGILVKEKKVLKLYFPSK